MLYKKSENSSIACQTAGPNKLNISVGTLNYPGVTKTTTNFTFFSKLEFLKNSTGNAGTLVSYIIIIIINIYLHTKI